MKTSRGPVLLLFFCTQSGVFGDTNAWIKPTSGYWEENPTNWSLGALPDQSQSIYITNTGFKAVAIGANTAQNFPQSMQIQDLQITSPTNSFNVLLMNFAGFQVPLQTTSLTVGSNSSVVVQSSMLEVSDSSGQNVNFLLNGTFSQGDFSQVNVHGRIAMGRSSEATYFLTNGTLSVSAGEDIGGFNGFGKFVRYGGTNNVTSIPANGEASLSLGINCEYDLYDGQLASTNGIIVGEADYTEFSDTIPSFYQYGGGVNADIVVNGFYYLNSGTITGNMQVVTGDY